MIARAVSRRWAARKAEARRPSGASQRTGLNSRASRAPMHKHSRSQTIQNKNQATRHRRPTWLRPLKRFNSQLEIREHLARPPIASRLPTSTRCAARVHHPTAASRSSSRRRRMVEPDRQLANKSNTPKNKKVKMQTTIKSKDSRISNRSRMLAPTIQKTTRRRDKISRITNFNPQTIKGKATRMQLSSRRERPATSLLQTTAVVVSRFLIIKRKLCRCQARTWAAEAPLACI